MVLRRRPVRRRRRDPPVPAGGGRHTVPPLFQGGGPGSAGEWAYLDENGKTVTEEQTGIYCLVGREARFKPVEVIYSAESFVLVRPASDQEKRRLRSGEQIIVSARGLFDGKVLQ